MPSTPTGEKPTTPQPEKRTKVSELEQRYGEIGISAVAAAMRFRDEPAESMDDHNNKANSRAA